jgi:hypothetical protein
VGVVRLEEISKKNVGRQVISKEMKLFSYLHVGKNHYPQDVS